ncbi:MAG: YegS/Rv2252/BmrU family lipid kinase [Bacteroidia bacterium]|nr:YegS/Rv2252/BmrU family lipid kinase [Bacteroidia bacterium]
MKKIAFILNPISGTGHKQKIIAYLHQVFDGNKDYSAVFHTTTSSTDAYESSLAFAKDNYDIVVAIGGDGTVNQVAKGIINSNTKLAVIPVGSGNGLARHLKIPLSYHSAIDAILKGYSISIDAGKMNDKVFFCTAGIGFEALIGDRFNSAGSRGLFTYMKFSASEWVNYINENYVIEVSGEKFKKNAFLITFANCAQWGNNAFIAPTADISDGMLDVVVWKKTPAVAMPMMTAGLFLKTIQYSEYVDVYRCKEIKITREKPGFIQYDGESDVMGQDINVSVIHHALKVIVPQHYDFSIQPKYIVPQLKDFFNKI